MKITINRNGGCKKLQDHCPKIGTWFLREDELAVALVLPSYYVIVYYVIAREPELVTVATTEYRWTPCEVELVVT